MTTRIVVHGWGVDGPTYDVETRRNGFRNRRNRFDVQNHGKRPNARSKDPEHHVVKINGEPTHVLFNQGFVYEAIVLIDAQHIETVHVDARNGYGLMPLADGIDLLDIHVDAGPSPELSNDDEDAPETEREVAIDEEE